MQWPDFINGAFFELFGGVIAWQNVRRILRDKQVRGIDWRVPIFWSFWSWWNLFYYMHLDQWWSWSGSLLLVVANTVWLFFGWKYRRN